MNSKRVEEQTGKKGEKTITFKSKRKMRTKPQEGDMHPKSGTRSLPGSGSDVDPGDPQTRAATTLVECVGPKYEEFEERWHSGGQRSSRRWRSKVPHIEHR